MKNVTIIIIEKHGQILDIITQPIHSITSFDWHADYPMHGEYVIDADHYAKQIDPVWYDQNWAIILASRGLVKEYTWTFPHDYSNEDVKIFTSKNGECRVFNRRFNKDMKIYSQYVTIDLDFFGNKIPVNWNPGDDKDRMELMKDVLETLKAEDIIMIISKSNAYVNYDTDKFLQDMITEISSRANIVDIE